jgi:LysM repeat protein
MTNNQSTNLPFLLLVLLLLVTLPAPVWAQSGGPGEPGRVQEHVVAAGETLFSIARRYGTTVDAIAHANGIPDPRQIFVGQRLVIPGSLGPVDTWTAHIVRPGETLSGIARQYGVDWRTLALANHLVNPTLLTVGQVVRIPTGRGMATGALHAVQPGRPCCMSPSGTASPSGNC